MKVKNIQKHDELAKRIRRMMSALFSFNMSEDQKKIYEQLREQAEQHERASIFQNTFIYMR